MRLRILALLAVLACAAPAAAQIAPVAYFVPASQCTAVASGNTTGTNGQTTAGASNTPVVQNDTSVTGTNTHTYICNLAPPASLALVTPRILIADAVFFYGEQNEISNTPAFVGASGTFNSSIVFSLINYPVAAASETASAVTPVRADSGTLIMTPVAASFNFTTTTAGAFFSIKFQPATPISWNTDLQQLLMTVTLKNYAGFASITNSPGVLVHIRGQ